MMDQIVFLRIVEGLFSIFDTNARNRKDILNGLEKGGEVIMEVQIGR